MPSSLRSRLKATLRALAGADTSSVTQASLDLAITSRWGMWPDRSRNPLTATPRRHWSQADEDGILEQVLTRILPGRAGTFLEFGSGDGTENNTLALLARGWSGGWAGAQPLAFEPHDSGRLAFRQTWLTRDNVIAITADLLTEVSRTRPDPTVDVISVDLDGNDHHVCAHLLRSGVLPRVWVVEVNGRFPLDVRWVMPYDPQHVWRQDDYYGASFAAMCDLFEDHDYRLVACSVSGVNAFFVRRDHASAFADVPSTRAELYQPPLYFIPGPLAHRASPATLRGLTAPALGRA